MGSVITAMKLFLFWHCFYFALSQIVEGNRIHTILENLPIKISKYNIFIKFHPSILSSYIPTDQQVLILQSDMQHQTFPTNLASFWQWGPLN